MSPHHYANGGVGEVSTNHFWSLRVKQHCSQIQLSRACVPIAISARIATSGSGLLGLKLGINDAFSSRIWISGLRTSSMEACCVFFCFITYEEVIPLAATLFTPKTPEVFCGLKNFTHTSICTLLSRWVNFHFSMNYPFNLMSHNYLWQHFMAFYTICHCPPNVKLCDNTHNRSLKENALLQFWFIKSYLQIWSPVWQNCRFLSKHQI